MSWCVMCRGLADAKQTGKLTQEQFCIAMHLIQQKITKGIDPPTTLTPDMIPPSERTTSLVGSSATLPVSLDLNDPWDDCRVEVPVFLLLLFFNDYCFFFYLFFCSASLNCHAGLWHVFFFCAKFLPVWQNFFSAGRLPLWVFAILPPGGAIAPPWRSTQPALVQLLYLLSVLVMVILNCNFYAHCGQKCIPTQYILQRDISHR